MNKQITAVLIGAGHRSLCYASYAKNHPDQFKIVAVAEPNIIRRKKAAQLYEIPENMCFETAAQLVSHKKLAHAAINGTMDRDHIPTSLPLLDAGYNILLEKPIGVNRNEVLGLLSASRKAGKKILVCHVLRYAPFYSEIRKRIVAGDIGQIMNIQTSEHVSYHHMSVGFVRGKWNSKKNCDSTFLMAKCCHDLDLITWMKSGIAPTRVSSFGSRMFFRADRAPKDAGTRCLVDCPIEKDCIYSARKIYIDRKRWGFYSWDFIENIENPTVEDKENSLKTGNPHGRCMWKCDNDVADHQSVNIEFADGSTATHNLIGGTPRPLRSIRILGTAGEIEGVMEEGKFKIYHPDADIDAMCTVEEVDTKVKGDGHGGGDLRLVEDFVNVLSGQSYSISSTTLEDSIYGHLIGFCADQAMEENRIVNIDSVV